MSNELIQHGDDREDKRWVKRRNKRVTELLDRVRNGSKDEQSLAKLAGSIEREWGGIDRFGESWVQSVRASQTDNPASSKTLTAFRDMAKVYIGISSAGRAEVDLSDLDDSTLNQLDLAETLVQLLTHDPWVLKDIISMVPTFDPLVLIVMLREMGYTVTGAEIVDVVEPADADRPAS